MGGHFIGSLDELEHSNTERSADWIKTEYNNQSNPGTFYTASLGIFTPTTDTANPPANWSMIGGMIGVGVIVVLLLSLLTRRRHD